jgi:hypothetical protein
MMNSLQVYDTLPTRLFKCTAAWALLCGYARRSGLSSAPQTCQRRFVVGICGTFARIQRITTSAFPSGASWRPTDGQPRMLRSKRWVTLAQQQVRRRWMARCRELVT